MGKSKITIVLLAALFSLLAGCISKDIHSKADQDLDGGAVEGPASGL